MMAAPFVGDILEKETTSFAPPSAPVLKANNGFPQHKKRVTTSRFKQSRLNGGSNETDASGSSQENGLRSTVSATPLTAENIHVNRQSAIAQTEKEQIDNENKAVIDHMSSTEIEEARNELLSSIDTSLLQNFLKRANIDSGSNEAAGDLRSLDYDTTEQKEEPRASKQDTKKVTFEEVDDRQAEDIVKPSTTEEDQQHDSIHFPRAPQPPGLDPSSKTFLEDLHTKYFPSLPAEPEKLDWMRTTNDAKSSYRLGQDALNPRDIRFAFTGDLIPPSRAAQIPVSQGLHHHGDAPDAAGYTIPELAHLSRSTYAPQRCIAFQTLGRILYRLGKGVFGDPGEPGANRVGAEDTFGELARGLWREVETQHVIEQLVAESEGNGIDGGRHISAKAYATEAVWLWRKGGGRRWNTD